MTAWEAGRRERIFKRDRFTCAYCSEVFEARDLSLDHVEPRIKGGDHSDGNLVTCCKACNELKAGQAAWSFLAADDVRRANFLKNAVHVWPRLIRAVQEAARPKP